MEDQTIQEDRYTRFVELLARNEQVIRRFARSLLPSYDGVDDVVQDTALECWKKFADFESGETTKDPDEFIRWAFVIARFKVLSRQRDLSRDRLCFRESVIEKLAITAMENLDSRDVELNSVQQCLERIDQSSRRLLLSVHKPGDSIARIAEETGQKARVLYRKINALRSLLLECVKQRMAEEL